MHRCSRYRLVSELFLSNVQRNPVMSESEHDMAKRDHSSRMAALAAKIESPQVVAEIDKVLRDMRQEWLDMIDLRKSAVRRHGERGSAPPSPVTPMPESVVDSPAEGRVAEPAIQPNAGLTLSELMGLYKSDPQSAYPNLVYSSRRHYDTVMNLIEKAHGDKRLSDVNGHVLKQWYESWAEGGNKQAIAHGKMGMLRRLFGFGVTLLDDKECVRLSTVLRNLRIKMPKKRTERLSADQAAAIRAKAHERDRPSIALAQAFQVDFGLTQKQTIGEWVPLSEDGDSLITSEDGREKWIRGICWEHIDDNLVLQIPGHDADGRVLSLRLAPTVLEELQIQFGFELDGTRVSLPASGPIIIRELDQLPWTAVEFRRWWRLLANDCGVPENVRNMDSRPKIGRRWPDRDLDDDSDFADGEELSLH
jgi:hypothetical protein